ncbi:MAG TPA: DNA-binding protein [Burkholderiales bacterium]|nr:DNA-binding protein [Burkholderiales bacterium]
MARAGILYSDVARAATKLVEDGRNPTVDSVREAMGATGSKSTIAPFLKRWKAEQQDTIATAEAGLPASLLDAVKGLHQHMHAECAQQLEKSQRRQAEELHAAAEREQQLSTERQAAIAANDALTEDLTRIREALAQLQAAHQAQSLSLATAQAENVGLQQRLADRAAEVATLDHQLSQARAQFEHYQEAAAAQRSEERQAADQRIARLDHDLVAANRQIAAQHSTLVQQEARITHLVTEQTHLQQALRIAQEDLATARLARDRFSEKLEEAMTERENLITQLSTRQQQLTDSRIALAAQERESVMLAEQVKRVETRVDRLTEEKLSWMQERAAMEQRLRIAEQQPPVAPER